MSIQTILNKWVGKKRDDCLEKDDFCDGHQEGYNQALAELRSKIPQIEKEILEEINKVIESEKLLEVGFDQCTLMWKQRINAKLDKIINQLKSK